MPLTEVTPHDGRTDRPLRVLAIDGGGVRGIIPARVLAELERRTGRPVAELFDLVVATSTGAILALGLTMPGAGGRPAFAAEEVVDLYLTHAAAIFPGTTPSPGRRRWGRRHRLAGRLAAAWHRAAGAKYPDRGLIWLLRECFGEARLREALTDVIVPSYEVAARRPLLFRSDAARADPAAHDAPLRDVVRAACAAPTYFAPARLRRPNGEQWTLIDGGVFANNPALLAYTEAQALVRRAPAPLRPEVLLVSLGTGQPTDPLPRVSEVMRWNLLAWARTIVPLMFDGLSDVSHDQLERLLAAADAPPCYWRLQEPLVGACDALDAAAPANLAALLRVAERLIARRDEELDAIAARLVAPTHAPAAGGTRHAAAARHGAAA